MADLLGEADVAQVGEALTDVTSATLEAGLAVAVQAIEAERRGSLPTRLAIVAMGRFGGHELGYGSDADVMFVHRPVEGADGSDASKAAHDVANVLRRLLALSGSDPALEVDTGLRPEGKQGPLVRSLDSYAAYYAKWSAVWEAQALLGAEASIGDPGCARRSPRLSTRCGSPRRESATRTWFEVRRVKARVDVEWLPRAPTRRPTSSWPGGRPTWSGPSSRCRCATPASYRPADDPDPGGAARRRGGRTADGGRRRRAGGGLAAWPAGCATRSCRSGAGERRAAPRPRDRAALATSARTSGESDELVNDYLRVTRRARQVVERLFWG